MRSFSTEGIIIKRRNFNEADRILTVLTRDYGKLQIKATGVRKITSRRAAHIELLNNTILHLYKGNTFSILTEAKVVDDFSLIKEDFGKIGLAYHLCELVDGLCPDNQENSKVFFLLRKALTDLACQDYVSLPQGANIEIDDYTLGTFGLGVNDASGLTNCPSDMLHNFEIALLSELGYWNGNNILLNQLDPHEMAEAILERKLKSRSIFAKLQ